MVGWLWLADEQRSIFATASHLSWHQPGSRSWFPLVWSERGGSIAHCSAVPPADHCQRCFWIKPLARTCLLPHHGHHPGERLYLVAAQSGPARVDKTGNVVLYGGLFCGLCRSPLLLL